MSSIGSDTHLNPAALERLGGQVALDDLRQQGGLQGTEAASDVAEVARADSAPTPQADAGERTLNLAAWEGPADGSRLLSGDLAFEGALGTLELSQAADHAADAVLDALG